MYTFSRQGMPGKEPHPASVGSGQPRCRGFAAAVAETASANRAAGSKGEERMTKRKR